MREGYGVGVRGERGEVREDGRGMRDEGGEMWCAGEG